ncbi:MAG: hypothetical protein B7Z37_30220 [Verrucomicrobia bacterium 12-59-8]|nr:MAG: hypothetical protein B7Z37_30220 [Verrucomicrobia bacterium 12-59-8]
MNSPFASSGSRATTRRKLLGISSLGLAGGVATYLGWTRSSGVPQPVQPAATPSPKTKPVAMEETPPPEPAAPAPTLFQREAFLPHVDSEFTLIHEGDATASCRLLSVGPESRTSSSKQTYSSFSLLFEAQPTFLRDGGLCQVEHTVMGQMQFFLSPVGKPGRTALLEAVFNLAV